MILYSKGDLLKADVEALVNAVNCVGVMGKGIALQFKQAFPGNFKAYEQACKQGKVKLGTMHVYETGLPSNPKYIINFPTKQHWKDKSDLQDVKDGLENLISVVQELNIKLIAIPPLGCGLGGLKWSDVQPLIENAFQKDKGVTATIYLPREE